MYIRITRGRLDPSKYDQLVSMAKDIEAAVRAAPGCQSYLGGGDRTAGTTIAVSTWDTEEHARLSRDVSLAAIMPRLQAMGLQLDPPEVYESLV
jgi:quinol monooxygenase YgiN